MVTNRTVNERIVHELSKQTIKSFIVDSLENKNLSAVVTDGDLQYGSILKEVAREFGIDNILHQLCSFHALKNLSKAVSKSVKTIKNRNLGLTTDYTDLKNSMKLIFNLDNEKIRKKYLNRLPDEHQKNSSLKKKARTIFEYFHKRNYHKYISHQLD